MKRLLWEKIEQTFKEQIVPILLKMFKNKF